MQHEMMHLSTQHWHQTHYSVGVIIVQSTVSGIIRSGYYYYLYIYMSHCVAFNKRIGLLKSQSVDTIMAGIHCIVGLSHDTPTL